MNPTIDDVFAELEQAGLLCYALKKEKQSIVLLYSDARIDEEKLNPIFDKYFRRFEITSSLPVYPEQLREYGFTPESLSPKIWEEVLEDGELVTIKRKN